MGGVWGGGTVLGSRGKSSRIHFLSGENRHTDDRNPVGARGQMGRGEDFRGVTGVR